MSNINPYNIDGTYPVAGQDNDSQGFRDNFTSIRNNFTYARNEITDLQSKAVLTQALTGGTLTNNMDYNILQYPQLSSPSYSLFNQGPVTTTLTIDYSVANVQKVQPNNALVVDFANWPAAGQYGAVQVWFYITNVAYTLTFATSSPGVTLGLSDIAGANPSTGVVTFDQPGNYVLEFSTVDGGQNIFINDRSRNNSTLRDPNLYFNNSVVSTLFVGFGSALSTAIAADAGRNTVMSDGAYSSVAVGNLTLSNVTYSTLDTGDAAGYNLTSARGNLAIGSILPVSSNDQLGYLNAVTFTGNGSGNAFTQTSRIAFFATGSNVTYGLGGNIAFYTGKNGNGGTNTVYQSLGLENDQSARVYGNLFLGTGGSSSTYVPTHNVSAGSPGQIAWDSGYFYVCTSPNTWLRVALNLSSW